MRELAAELSGAAHRFAGTKEYYDGLMIDAGQILIAMVAVLMRHIGNCTTSANLATLFNDTAAMSFAVAVNEYIAAACNGKKVTIQDQMEHTYKMSKNIDFLDKYQKKLLRDISAKFEIYFTRVVPAETGDDDDWAKWNNHDMSLDLIREFFGSVFLFYYLRAMRDVYPPKNFVDIETIRLCLFRDPQIKIGQTAVDKAYYGDRMSGGHYSHYSILMDKIRHIAPIRAFCMLCQNTEILVELVGISQRFSSSPCSSPFFAMLCGVFTHLPTVLPLLETVSYNSWTPDIPDIDAGLAKKLYTIIKTVAGIFMDSRSIENFKIEECQICGGTDIQRRTFNTDGSAGLILGKVCSKLCQQTRLLCTSCATKFYKISLAQRLDAQQRAADENGQALPRGWARQMPENLRCLCSTPSFGADIVPFIVAEGIDKTGEIVETGGITLHPVIDQLMRVIIEMDPASAEKWGPILGDRNAIKPSLKSIIEEFKNIFGSLFKLGRYFYLEDNHEIRRKRWILLITKFDNPELAQFIPKFVVLQKGDIYCQFYIFLKMLEEFSEIEDQHQTMLDEEEAARVAREAREEAHRVWAEDRAARLGANNHLDNRERSRSPPRRRGGRLNRRTKKRSHGKNLPKSKPKSKTKPKSKSKSKKSKKYNKTRSNRL